MSTARAKTLSPAPTAAVYVAGIRSRGKVEPLFIEKLELVAAMLKDVVRPGDVILTQGAGNIGAIAAELAAADLS